MLAEDKITFGYEVLGPLTHKFLWSIDGHICLRPDTSHAFVARAGVRIKQLYEAYAEAVGLERRDVPILWTSRLLLAKGTFKKSPMTVAETVAAEYRGKTISDVLRGFWRHEPEWLDKLDASDPALRGSSESLLAFLDAGSGPASLLDEYLDHYANLLDRYLSLLLAGRDSLALIDSGWHGSPHALLSKGYPNLDIQSLLWGRVARAGEFSAHMPDVIGLMFEADEYDSSNPNSAIIFHRHLIEGLFETAGPSIETIEFDDDGQLVVPGLEANLADSSDSGSAYREGIRKYLTDHAGLGPSQIIDRATKAADALRTKILYPTLKDVPVLTPLPRSADFGRDFSVPVVLDPEDRTPDDSVDLRINEALWKQGQLINELGESGARAELDALSAANATSYFDPLRTDSSVIENATRVAVVTRTKNRGILLKRAAESVASQSHSNYVWVVVNDGGNHEEVDEILRMCPVEQDRILLVSNPASVGMESASTLGISFSESEFIVIHDDDDSWDPHFLRATVGFLTSDIGRAYDGVVTNSIYVSEEIVHGKVKIHDRFPYNPWLRTIQLAEMAVENLFPPIAFLYRRSIYESIGGFDQSLPVLGDWDFNLRFLAVADIGRIYEPLAYYHHRDRMNRVQFSNSIIGGQNLHEEYGAVVRNRFIRNADTEMLGRLIAQGYGLSSMRHYIDCLKTPAMASMPESIDGDDDWWLSLVGLYRRQRQEMDSFQSHSFLQKDANVLSRQFEPPRPKDPGTIEEFIEVARKDVDAMTIPIPSSFDEQEYLNQNPDVAEAVKKGDFLHGYSHYLVFGRAEGRSRPRR